MSSLGSVVSKALDGSASADTSEVEVLKLKLQLAEAKLALLTQSDKSVSVPSLEFPEEVSLPVVDLTAPEPEGLVVPEVEVIEDASLGSVDASALVEEVEEEVAKPRSRSRSKSAGE